MNLEATNLYCRRPNAITTKNKTFWEVSKLSGKFFFSGQSPTINPTLYQIDWPKQTFQRQTYEATQSFEPEGSFERELFLELIGDYQKR